MGKSKKVHKMVMDKKKEAVLQRLLSDLITREPKGSWATDPVQCISCHEGCVGGINFFVLLYVIVAQLCDWSIIGDIIFNL